MRTRPKKENGKTVLGMGNASRNIACVSTNHAPGRVAASLWPPLTLGDYLKGLIDVGGNALRKQRIKFVGIFCHKPLRHLLLDLLLGCALPKCLSCLLQQIV